MVGNLVLSELLFAVIYVVAFLVLREFIKARDGMLRRIMIAYFCVEIFVYLGSAIYFFMVAYNMTTLSINAFRILIIFPKVVVKLWLLWWLKTGRATVFKPNTKS